MRKHYLKLVESKVNEQVIVPWERLVPMLIKLQPNLFHLLPYMLRKFNWESSSLDDFKAKLASYWACPKGWDECVDIVFYNIIWVVDPQRPSKPIIGL